MYIHVQNDEKVPSDDLFEAQSQPSKINRRRNFSPGVYLRYNIRTNALYKEFMKYHPAQGGFDGEGGETQAYLYENPILAYFTDTRTNLPPERFSPEHPNHISILSDHLPPNEEHQNTGMYYTLLMSFLKEAIQIYKAGRIYIEKIPLKQSHMSLHTPCIIHLNQESGRVGKISPGEWWGLDYRKISALAIIGSDSTLYDELLHDGSCIDQDEYGSYIDSRFKASAKYDTQEYYDAHQNLRYNDYTNNMGKISNYDFVNCAKFGARTEICVVGIITRRYGQREEKPAILKDMTVGTVDENKNKNNKPRDENSGQQPNAQHDGAVTSHLDHPSYRLQPEDGVSSVGEAMSASTKPDLFDYDFWYGISRENYDEIGQIVDKKVLPGIPVEWEEEYATSYSYSEGISESVTGDGEQGKQGSVSKDGTPPDVKEDGASAHTYSLDHEEKKSEGSGSGEKKSSKGSSSKKGSSNKGSAKKGSSQAKSNASDNNGTLYEEEGEDEEKED